MPIHPTALVAPDARLADDVEVGPFAVIDGPAEIGSGTTIAGHAWINGRVSIAANCTIGWGVVIGAPPQDLAFDPATDSGVEIGRDNTIREYCTIHRGSKPGSATRIGSGNLLMGGSHVGHDCAVGSDCAIANNVLLAGHVTIGSRCFLGGGAGFHQFIHVGDLALVRGNAGISQDVPPFCMVHGFNKLAGLNVVGLRRAGFDADARAEIKRLFSMLFRSRLPFSEALRLARAETWSEAPLQLLEAAAAPSRKGIITRG